MSAMNRRVPFVAGRAGALAIGLMGAVLVLGGCDDAREAFGLTRNTPDEFRVASRAPLSVPPSFDLRPPTPGAPRPQETAPRDLAVSALGGRSGDVAVPEQASAAEAALITQATPGGVDPDIRRTVDLESDDLLRANSSFVDDLLFWQEPALPGTVVDPTAESQRLSRTTALGEPINSGEVPTIERTSTHSLLDDLGSLIPF